MYVLSGGKGSTKEAGSLDGPAGGNGSTMLSFAAISFACDLADPESLNGSTSIEATESWLELRFVGRVFGTGCAYVWLCCAEMRSDSACLSAASRCASASSRAAVSAVRFASRASLSFLSRCLRAARSASSRSRSKRTSCWAASPRPSSPEPFFRRGHAARRGAGEFRRSCRRQGARRRGRRIAPVARPD